MANIWGTTVLFAKENNLTILSAHVTFGATGIPTLDTVNSKGICNFAVDAVAFNGNSVASSSTISSVTSFVGLYPGMTVNGGLNATGTTTISSISAGTSLTLLSGTNIGTTNGGLITATGGRFRVQFGSQAAQRLDAYPKLLDVHYSWDMSASSASGSATVQALTPAVGQVFVVQNNTKIRTIPKVATSGSSDCSLVIQMMNGGSIASPVAGTGLRVFFVFGNSTAL